MVLVIMWISLGARHLNIFKNSFNKHYKYEIYSIPDDRIIFFSASFHRMFHSMSYIASNVSLKIFKGL